MRVVTGGDWSIGLGQDSELDAALLNACLGEGLRNVFSDTVEQPLPQEFSSLLEKMDRGVADRESTFKAGCAPGDGQ